MVVLNLAFELLYHAIEGGLWELLATAIAMALSVCGAIGGLRTTAVLWRRYLTGVGTATALRERLRRHADRLALLRLLAELSCFALLICPPPAAYSSTVGEGHVLYWLHLIAFSCGAVALVNNRLGRDL